MRNSVGFLVLISSLVILSCGRTSAPLSKLAQADETDIPKKELKQYVFTVQGLEDANVPAKLKVNFTHEGQSVTGYMANNFEAHSVRFEFFYEGKRRAVSFKRPAEFIVKYYDIDWEHSEQIIKAMRDVDPNIDFKKVTSFKFVSLVALAGTKVYKNPGSPKTGFAGVPYYIFKND